MFREDVLRILHLSENYTKDEIEENYQKLRKLYYPPRYEGKLGRDAEGLKEQLYKNLSGEFYRKPKRSDACNGFDPAFWCFIRYAEVCEAYKYMNDPKNHNKYGVDPKTTQGYDTIHYGKVVAFIRNNFCAALSILATILAIAVLILSCCNLHMLIPEISGVVLLVYGVVLGFIYLCHPLDFLLFLPKRIWNGIRSGASMGFWLTKPITVLVMPLIFFLGGILGLFFLPAYVMKDRDDRCGPYIKTRRAGRKAAEKQFLQAEKMIEEQQQKGMTVIDGHDPFYQKAVDTEWETCERLRKEFHDATEEHEKTMEKAEKRRNRMERMAGWGAEGDLDYYSQYEADIRWAEDEYENTKSESTNEVYRKLFDYKRQQVLCQELQSRLR